MSKQRGDILIVTLFLLAAFVVVLGAFAHFASRQAAFLTDKEQEGMAFRLAEAGVDYTLWLLNEGGAVSEDLPGTTRTQTVTHPTGDAGWYELTFSGDAEALTVAAKGHPQQRPDLCQEIQATLRKLEGAVASNVYYIAAFDQVVSPVCPTPPTPRGRGGRGR